MLFISGQNPASISQPEQRRLNADLFRHIPLHHWQILILVGLIVCGMAASTVRWLVRPRIWRGMDPQPSRLKSSARWFGLLDFELLRRRSYVPATEHLRRTILLTHAIEFGSFFAAFVLYIFWFMF